MEERSKEFTQEQIRAIYRAYTLAEQLQKDIPEIADLYKEGKHSAEIVKIFDISNRYGVNEELARVAVSTAIRGHSGCFNIKSLEGLITDTNELEELEKRHQRQAGIDMYYKGQGFHSETNQYRAERASRMWIEGKGLAKMSKKERVDTSSKAGKTAVLEKKGVHGFTFEELSEIGKRGIIKSMKTRGIIPWTDYEKDLAYKLSRAEEYQYQNGRNYGRPIIKDIADKLNKDIHNGKNVRSNVAVQWILAHYTQK